MGLGGPGPVMAETGIPHHILRQSAEAGLNAARSAQSPDMFVSALEMYVDGGAVFDANDPWDASALLSEALALASGRAGLEARLAVLSGGRRGVVQGPTRLDTSLQPGEVLRQNFIMANGELAAIALRLKGSSNGADLDLRVVSETGGVIAEDMGPETGVPGIGLFVEWSVQGCDAVDVEVTNQGSGAASFVMMAPPSPTDPCG